MDYTFLKEAYQTDKWKDLLSNLFQTNADIFSEPYEIPVDKKRIESAYQLGNIYLNDQLATQLALFEFKLKPNTTKLQINRVALQKIVKHLNDNAALTGAFAVYVDEALGKWRFSFIAKQQFWEEDGTLQVLETDPKRYTYVFGIGEKVLTAQQRFDKLATIRNKSLEDITDAFSVEKVSKEFFLKYKKHYENLCDYLYQHSKALQIFKIKNKDKEEQIRKNIRDFVKKMMGRLVFLYFLQKKEWMGVPLYRKDWKGGEVDFMRKLFDHCQDQDRFYSKYLSPLFFDTLNDPKRKKDNYAYQATWGMVKVPYLNGGLFDETIPEARTIDFPADYFDRLLAFFSQYNFTIDENSPNDHEIGIDPEMLGHIFENLLEENRLKGAYYTPKEIVHYMCQESLLQYLKTKLLTTPKPKKVIWSDSQAADEKELELFVRQKKRGKKNNFIYKNAHEIEAALKNVKICDPAIGSGAFPMGLLYEIFHCQIELDLTEDYAALKREIIENCIYGVDKDKGAVDIAQLRFWLALVVNEEVPKILPNLDYKIMQGDSLLERFEDIDLSKLLSKEQETEKPLSTGQTSLFSEPEAKYVRLNTKEKAKIKKLLHDFFKADTPNKKKELQQNIDTRINTTIDKTLRKNKINLLFKKEELARIVANDKKLKRRVSATRLKELDRLENTIVDYEQKQKRLYDTLQQLEKPYFLWHTYFKEVFDEGGFDIVIGNPPYYQIQKLDAAYKKILAASNYDTYTKSGDLYCLFYEKAIQILKKDKGILAFITSNSWLKTRYGESLRAYFVQHTNPLVLLNFEDTQVFQSAIVETNILLAQTGKSDDDVLVVNVDKGYDGSGALNLIVDEKGYELKDINGKAWEIGNKETLVIKRLIEQDSILLGNITNNKINFGIKTGFNKAFFIDVNQKNEIISNDRKSKEIIKPLLRGRNVQKYFINYTNQWLIFTKRGIEIELYNGVKEHLNKYYEKLKPRNNQENVGRKPGSYKWYEIQDNVAYHTMFEEPKIIWGELSDKPKFYFDNERYYPEATLFLMTGEKLKYLLAILNSKLSEWYFAEISTTSGMGTNRWKKYKIQRLPIRETDSQTEKKVETLVDYILFTKKQLQQFPNSENQLLADYIEQVIDGVVFEIYFGDKMKAANRDILRHFPALIPFQEDFNSKEKQAIVQQFFNKIHNKQHPIRNNLLYMRNIEEIGIILDQTK